MDQLIDINCFKHLNGKITEREFKNIKILSVFANNSKIYVTHADEVYGFGDNGFGCLGLGVMDPLITRPTLNRTLTHKRLSNIFLGYSHCIGMTRTGQCYSWGFNDFGQLGDGSTDTSATPRLIEGLRNKRVVYVGCGSSHNLAITCSGRLYAWGRNHTGQLGDNTFEDRYWPTLIPFDCKIRAVCCGKTHSIALNERGMAYVWGSNKFGQLGRKSIMDSNTGKAIPSAKPLLVNTLATDVFTRISSGPLHSLLLTSSGDLYSFGINEFGQIGNGSEENQYIPVRINGDIKFKDIATSYINHISTALSVDNKFYVWGLIRDGETEKYFLKPEEIRLEPTEPKTLFQLYAKFGIYRITYLSICVDNKEVKALYPLSDDTFGKHSNHSKNYDSSDSAIASNQTLIANKIPKTVENLLNNSMTTKSNPILNSLIDSFNNRNNYDIRFRINSEDIFAHKIIISIRNQKFWQNCEKRLDKENNEIRVEDHSYESIFALIRYFYTNSVNIETEFVVDLLRLADIYEEKEIKDNCKQFLANNLDLENICKFYTKAIEQELQELEKICIEFVVKYYRIVCLTLEYREMNDSFAKKMIISAMNCIEESNSSSGSKRSSVESESESNHKKRIKS